MQVLYPLEEINILQVLLVITVHYYHYHLSLSQLNHLPQLSLSSLTLQVAYTSTFYLLLNSPLLLLLKLLSFL